MQTKSELERSIYNAQNRYNSVAQTVADCNKQIARLEPVYKQLEEIKREYRSLRKATIDVFSEKGVWKGSKRDSFRELGDELDIVCGEYYKTLDAAHDVINVKIGELRAEKARKVLLLGDLFAQIEQWRVDIENLKN